LQLLPSFSAKFSGVTTIERLDWIPTAGLDLAFRVDGLRLL
jgi:multicomponent K+:H+ antiporter subunit A